MGYGVQDVDRDFYFKKVYHIHMQDLTLTHANTFFFITTIAVAIGIIILLVLLFIFLRVLKAVKSISARVEKMVDKTSDKIETSEAASVAQKSLPLLLSVVGLFTKKKKVDKKVAKK